MPLISHGRARLVRLEAHAVPECFSVPERVRRLRVLPSRRLPLARDNNKQARAVAANSGQAQGRVGQCRIRHLAKPWLVPEPFLSADLHGRQTWLCSASLLIV